MGCLASVDVNPADSQVAIVDATWQDYPSLEVDEEVGYAARSLLRPERPPYPGFAVATRSSTVSVEVWSGHGPPGLRLAHVSELYVGGHGVEIGSERNGELHHIALPPGNWPMEIWVDAATAEGVTRVVFVLTSLTQ